MDTLTHALSGALCARATAPKKPSPAALPLGRRVSVGFLAGMFPDIDFVAGYFGQLAWLYQHRGVTHSLLMLPLWAFALAWLFSLFWRRDRSWRAYFGVTACVIGVHIAGDWITAFGTMLLAPFSDARFRLSTTFIIDLWFTGIIVAGLAFSLVWRRSRLPAVAGVAVLAAYVASQFVLQQQAVEVGSGYARDAGLEQARVSALPRPVSPFNWTVIVDDGERYHYSHVSLWRREMPRAPAPDAGLFERLGAAYLPADRARWERAERFGATPAQGLLAKTIMAQPQFEFFRWFAEYPVLYRIDAENPGVCVWFQDLRFFTPGRDAWPFRYGMCREGAGPWTPFELVGDNTRIPVR
ncbi:MAG: metal-dependent hydrolase, partial [Burkholderiales bacterium]|nr:metal-dependent hydrolase [Burkholderiales bacterium]